MELKQIQVSKIRPDPKQPRDDFEDIEELAETYADDGVIVPIQITEDNLIIVGERRWRAAKQAGLQTMPCIVKKKLTESEIDWIRAKEDVQKKDWKPLERAKAWNKLLKEMVTGNRSYEKGLRQLSRRLGVPHSTIYQTLLLLKPEYEDLVERINLPRDNKERIPLTTLRALEKVKNPKTRKELKQRVKTNDIETRAQLENEVRLAKMVDSVPRIKKGMKKKNLEDLIPLFQKESLKAIDSLQILERGLKGFENLQLQFNFSKKDLNKLQVILNSLNNAIVTIQQRIDSVSIDIEEEL